MKWEEFLNNVVDLPVIDVELLLPGVSDPRAAKVQISRWEKSGRLLQLKRGIYLLAKPYRRIEPFMPYIASLLKEPSYLSLEKALEYYNLIPEAVYVYTSVTTKWHAEFVTDEGRFSYQHIQKPLFWGYNSITANRQTAFIASPEKALLDFLYFKRGVNITLAYIEELRLQNFGEINLDKLSAFAKRFEKPRIINAAKLLIEYIKSERETEKTL